MVLRINSYFSRQCEVSFDTRMMSMVMPLKNLRLNNKEDDFNDDGRFSDDSHPPTPIEKNFHDIRKALADRLIHSVSFSSGSKNGINAKKDATLDRSKNSSQREELAEASPTYTQPLKSSKVMPKVTRSPSIHPIVKPPPPPSPLVRKTCESIKNKSQSFSIQTNDLMITSSSMNDLNSISSSSDDSCVKPCYDDDLIEKMAWFHGNISRPEAEQRLKKLKMSGAFLIRHKSAVSPNVPFCLSVLANKRVYHLEIRLKANGFFALGKPKDDELEFSCLQALVHFYKRQSLRLITCSSKSPDNVSCSTILTVTLKKAISQ